jgi:peptidoglycan/xylan/chitin deacetylase (PgdA/CDA1 family)
VTDPGPRPSAAPGPRLATGPEARPGTAPAPFWPDGYRAAAAISFDVDAESAILADRPEAAARLTVMSHQAYGPQVGVPRLLRILERRGLGATFFVPGYTADRHPDAVRAIQDAGHEIGHHGYLHEPVFRATAEEEESYLVRGLEALDRVAGVRPAGYRAPWWETTYRTPGLLARHGFRYDSSLMDGDRPYRLGTSADRGAPTLIEIPIQWALDEVEDEMDLLNAVVAGPFVVRDAADDVAAEPHRLAHQLLPVGEREDAVLGEGDEAKVDDVADLLAELEEGAQGDEVRVADVDVRSDQAGALGHFPADGLQRATLDVVVGERRLALGPGEDPLDERARLVEARLADGEDGVEVDVRVDQRRREQPARGVKDGRPSRDRPTARADRGDPVALDEQVDGLRSQAARGMESCVADQEGHRDAGRSL